MKTGPKFKICRRLGERIFPKCQTTKFTISSGGLAKPGKAGGGRRSRSASDYGSQLREKQKARYTYGVNERQFRNYVERSRKLKTGNPLLNLGQLVESRLDNVVYRLGLVSSRAFARQVVGHGHILVNGRRVTIPSYAVSVGDVISIRSQSRDNGVFREVAERLKEVEPPSWLLYTADREAKVVAEPMLEEAESNLNLSAIIDFYSRV
ncbi:MAG TPA: 30S ribosomal protein S4 [Candidatus Paceibacterota bacterium]